VRILVDTAPTGTDGSVSTLVNQTLRIAFPCDDADGDGLFIEWTEGDHGIVDFDEITEEFVYTPAQNYVGRDSFIYAVRDDFGLTSGPDRTTIEVKPAPVATVVPTVTPPPPPPPKDRTPPSVTLNSRAKPLKQVLSKGLSIVITTIVGDVPETVAASFGRDSARFSDPFPSHASATSTRASPRVRDCDRVSQEQGLRELQLCGPRWVIARPPRHGARRRSHEEGCRRHASGLWSVEEQGRERAKVVTPGVPHVASRAALEPVLDVVLVEERSRGDVVLPRDVLGRACDPDQLRALVDGAVPEQVGVVALEVLARRREPAGAEVADVGELARMLEQRVERPETAQ
jgi:hypothetical protein